MIGFEKHFFTCCHTHPTPYVLWADTLCVQKINKSLLEETRLIMNSHVNCWQMQECPHSARAWRALASWARTKRCTWRCICHLTCGRRECSRLFDDDENLSWRSPLLLWEVSADSALQQSLDVPKLWSGGVWEAVAYKTGDHRVLNIMRFTSFCIRCELVPKACLEVLIYSSDRALCLGRWQISHFFRPYLKRQKSV